MTSFVKVYSLGNTGVGTINVNNIYLCRIRPKNLVFRATVLKTLGRVGSFF